MEISVREFTQIIRKSWNQETSGFPEQWSSQNPSCGQCLVTALLAHEILWLSVYTEKITLRNKAGYHYFNKDTDNKEHRFCEEQFIGQEILWRDPERSLDQQRIDILLERNPDIKKRYEFLKQNFQQQIHSILQAA